MLVEHTGRTSFYVEGLEKFFKEKDSTYDLPNIFMIQILGIAYTHARALLSVEISPTIYRDNYFLPVVDPANLLPKNKTIK